MIAQRFYLDADDVSCLYVVGAGGHGRETAWLATQCVGGSISIIHLVDRAEYLTGPVNGNPVELLSDISVTDATRYVVAVGDVLSRRRLVGACGRRGLRATSLVHPRAEISDSVNISEGVLIAAGSVVTTNVELGIHVHINVGCTVSHDVSIGAYSSLSPGVHVSGNVVFGEGVFVGTGASIINGLPDRPLVIGDGAVIAAGACVTEPVSAGATVAGVPATLKQRRRC